MNLKPKFKLLLALGGVLLFTSLTTSLTLSSASLPTISGPTEPIVIEYEGDSFSIQSLTVTVGSTVTWRNNTDTALNLRGDAIQNTVNLPLIVTGGSGGISQQTGNPEMDTMKSASSAHRFETIIAARGEFSHQLNAIGRFQFMDQANPDSKGQIVVTPLTRIYSGDDGSALYLRTVGDRVYGFGEHPGQEYAYVLSGILGDNHISARFWDIPKATRTNDGDVFLNVYDDGAQLVLESSSTAIGAEAWQEIAPGTFDWPEMQAAGFQATTTDDLTGAFVGDDDSRHYIRQVDGDIVVWAAEAPAQPGERPAWASVFIGQIHPADTAQATGLFADVPKGLTNAAGTFNVQTANDRTLDLTQPQVNRAHELEPDYAVDWDLFESGIRDALDNKAIGYAYAIGKGQGLMRSDAGGFRLLSQDGGPALFTEHTQAQAFSTSKTMTAVALVKALYENDLTVDHRLAPFLPGCWEQGEGIGTITFRELLNHTSGLPEPKNSDPYLLLKGLIAADVGPKVYNYNNVAYGLMRYLIPFVTEEAAVDDLFATYNCQTEGAEINLELSTMFGDYLFGMLDEVGVEATFFKDEYPGGLGVFNVAYLYNRNFEWYKGIQPNPDGWLKAGAGYIATSVLDYRRFLGALDQGQILPEFLVDSMYDGNLGFDGPITGAAGEYYQKDGIATGTCGAGGKAQLMIYPSGIHAYIMMNSVTHGNAANWEYLYDHTAGAYDEAVLDWGLSDDLPLAGDFDRDGEVDDIAVFRPSTQDWYYDYDHDGLGPFGAYDELVLDWGESTDLPLAGDFDGDGYVDDVARFQPSTQNWYYDYDHDGIGRFGAHDEEVSDWGENGDLPLAGDFDRDGYVDDVAVFRPSARDWYYDYDHDGLGTPGSSDVVILNWGKNGDLPIAGDFDGDSYADDVAVYRPSGQDWYYDYDHDGLGTSDSTDESVSNWGNDGDQPIAGDFDRDGDVDDVALYRPLDRDWYYDYDHEGGVLSVPEWGKSGDIPLAGDFDRDGYFDDVAVFRPWSWDWYYDYDHDGGPSDEIVADWGNNGDLPLAGDFDRDGFVDDVAVFRPSTRDWYYDYDHDGLGPFGAYDELVTDWGLSGDLPLAGDFDSDGYVNDVAVYRPSEQEWYYDYDHDRAGPFGTHDEEVSGWGDECDVPIGGDFDRDGDVDDVGVFRLTNGRWYYDYDHDGGSTADESQPAWGNGAGLPLAGDFDGDGQIDDVGFFRNTGLVLEDLLQTAFDDALK